MAGIAFKKPMGATKHAGTNLIASFEQNKTNISYQDIQIINPEIKRGKKVKTNQS